MDGARISVALCTYNGARFLSEQLESIAWQSLRPYELVACDDGSNDDTLEILRTFARSSPFPVRIFNRKNIQLGCTRNFERAIRLCDGNVISLADQDDIWEPDKLALLATALAKVPDAGYSFSDAEVVDHQGRALAKRMWDSVGFTPSRISDFVETNQVRLLLRRAVATGATMIFRSDLRSSILPLSPYFVHDYWISTLSSCIGHYGVPVPQPLVRYRQHSSQQIGPPDSSWARKIKRARTRELATFKARVFGCEELIDRLEQARRAGCQFPATHLELLSESLAHCTRRVVAHTERGAKRWGKVLPEILTGRYSLYSNSWMSIVEDLCF
jgi:glycosyltransferase involved in cell wall biosynthesis